jgi:hypothetical protein
VIGSSPMVATTLSCSLGEQPLKKRTTRAIRKAIAEAEREKEPMPTV